MFHISSCYCAAPGTNSPSSFSTTKPASSIWLRTFSAFDADATFDFDWRTSCSSSLMRYSCEAWCAILSISLSLISSISARVRRRLLPTLRRWAELPFWVDTAVDPMMISMISGSISTFMSCLKARESFLNSTLDRTKFTKGSPITVWATLIIH